MNYSHQRLSLGVVGILLLISASCGGTGENEQRDRPVHDDPTKPLRTAITGKVIAECLGHEDAVTGVAISPDGGLLVSASWDKTLRFWSLPEGKLIRTIGTAKPRSGSGCIGPPHFSPDGKTVAALFRRKSVNLCFWDAATGKELPRSVPIEGRGLWALSPDGELVARVIDIDCVGVSDTSEGKSVREFRFRKEERVVPGPMSFSPDGKFLALGLGDRGGVDGIQMIPKPPSVSSLVRVWDLRTGKLAFASEFLPLTREARKMVIGPDGEWEYPPEKQPTDTLTVAFSPDGSRLAAGGNDSDRVNSIWVWDLATRKLVQKLPVGEPPVLGLAFSPDGHMVACATGPSEKHPDSVIQVWNVTSAKLLGSLQKHTDGGVKAVTWAKDGRTLVSCGWDRRVLVWRLEPRNSIVSVSSWRSSNAMGVACQKWVWWRVGTPAESHSPGYLYSRGYGWYSSVPSA